MDQVTQVRRFSRTVTQRIGALDEAYLALGRPLGQARVLWEIGPHGAEVRSLRSRLDLDSGYLSRVLRVLEADGLVAVEADTGDGRVHRVRLTPAGVAVRAEFDRRADDLASSILQPLSDRQRDRLVTAMAEVERLLVASTVRVEVTDPRHPHARHCMREFVAELDRRFEGGFDPVRGLPADDQELTPPAGLFLVATLHEDPVGCGGIELRPGAPARIRRVWVAPHLRGLGLGRRLLAELESRAAASGARLFRLETNRALTEAIELYRATGYREVDPFNDALYAHHWFEKALEAPEPDVRR